MDINCEETCKYSDECQYAGQYAGYDLDRRCKYYKQFQRNVKSERKDRLDRRKEKGRDDDDIE